MSLLNYFSRSPTKPPTKRTKTDNLDTKYEVPEENPAPQPTEDNPLNSETETKREKEEDSELTQDQIDLIEKNRQKALAIRKSKEENNQFKNSLLQTLIEPSWKDALAKQFSETYFNNLMKFLESEKKIPGLNIYPPTHLIFNALNSCPLSEVSVVILGQDPYHGAKQAMGLSFSVPKGVPIPPSLRNMYKELSNDPGVEFKTPSHGNLQEWANQGVLLLNTALTVREKKANSHAEKGWEKFTDSIISLISSQCNGVAFVLWGRNAQSKEKLISVAKHKVFKAAHPSPFSADKFFGCKHFSKVNAYLESIGKTPINWQISENPPEARTIESQDLIPAVSIGKKRPPPTDVED